jgi:cytochrome c oxidase subunit 2
VSCGWLRPPVSFSIVGVADRARQLLRLGPIGGATLAGGCAWDGPRSTLVARTDFAHDILRVYGLITWIAIGIAAVVTVTLVWVLLRFREKPDQGLPRQVRGHALLEISWTVAPAIVLLVIAVPTIAVVFRTQAMPAKGVLEVVVKGHQWWWEFAYPGYQVTTANELHLPSGRAATLVLEGPDVIHSFWVPQLGGKRDVIPGRVNRLTFTPEAPGEYLGQCAEFCGTSHANMGLRVIVDAPDAFDRWVETERAPASQPPAGPAAEGAAVFASSACVGCHTVRGVSAGMLGPDLTHFGGRRTLAAGMLPNTVDNVAVWIRDPQRIKPGAKMPALGLSEAQARAVATYLAGLK